MLPRGTKIEIVDCNDEDVADNVANVAAVVAAVVADVVVVADDVTIADGVAWTGRDGAVTIADAAWTCRTGDGARCCVTETLRPP